ncbi:MAG TPA: glycine cleavage system protein GcvH [Vicinamibacterales bacterium]|jgi:glycine cleavage system H protein|nr:glycine cleavage system protein GcvH [Vicinamibacterales bacterium]
MYPTDLKYTKDHEWVKIGANEATVGITDFAQGQLGDVVFVELPAVGRQVKQGEIFGTIESVKAVSELFSPVSGEVIAVNDELGVHPEQVNARPHEAWMIKLRPTAAGETDTLLDAAAYTALVK